MPLNRQQLARLERELDENYRRLLGEVRNELEASNDQHYTELVNGDPADAGDASVADLLASLNLSAIDRHIAEIRDIDAARARIKDGSYSLCSQCGGEIGFERLQAYPTAKRCLRCQQQHERTHAGAGMPTL